MTERGVPEVAAEGGDETGHALATAFRGDGHDRQLGFQQQPGGLAHPDMGHDVERSAVMDFPGRPAPERQREIPPAAFHAADEELIADDGGQPTKLRSSGIPRSNS